MERGRGARWAAALVLAVALPARAAPDGAPEPEPAAASPSASAAQAFTFQGRLEWLTAAGASAPRDTGINPDNAVLGIPQLGAGSELRPDLRVQHGDALRLVVRPRLRLDVAKARAAGAWRAERSDASAEWLELHGSWRVDERLEIAYGLQNFQWGPGELLSPSNRIFHETGFARDPLYVVRGRHLARVNLSAGSAWSAVVLAEVAANDEPPFVAGEPFEPKAEAKLEWTPRGGGPYLGVVAGAGRRSRGFFGEYASLPVTDGLSLYADVVHTAGTRAWYPVEDGAGGAGFAQRSTGAGLRTLALGGARYTFASGPDLRIELVFDEAGWTEAELALAARAASGSAGTPPSPAALAAWLDPGFELPGRRHAYVSLRLPELPPGDRLTVAARYLAALEDGSGAAFVTASLDASDSVVVFASAIATHGPDHGALSRLVRGTATAGAVVSW